MSTKISNSINKEIIHIRRELEEINKNFKYHNEEYKELIKLLRAFVNEADNYLVKSKGTEGYEEVLEFYYEVRSFIAARATFTIIDMVLTLLAALSLSKSVIIISPLKQII